ncbi:MAG: hypothetical protein ACD_23C01095G0001 [uncultured bacterium]|nr:MAG: hypothetical protein ACD_23C01095G0001 [uncultured bacterium]
MVGRFVISEPVFTMIISSGTWRRRSTTALAFRGQPENGSFHFLPVIPLGTLEALDNGAI